MGYQVAFWSGLYLLACILLPSDSAQITPAFSSLFATLRAPQKFCALRHPNYMASVMWSTIPVSGCNSNCNVCEKSSSCPLDEWCWPPPATARTSAVRPPATLLTRRAD